MAGFIKRKTADRNHWRRVTKKSYVQRTIETEEFRGFISLLRIDQIADPLYIDVKGESVCIADEGFFWLGQLPQSGNYAVTAMFDAGGHIVQWYIDICENICLDERGIPSFDDLFLDLRVTPDGDCELLDEDELEAALASGVISQRQYDVARREAARILAAIGRDEFLPLCKSALFLAFLLEHI
ncbi:DUF402 domain-containing protein [Alicyclobacillus fastidiosus]|uniref:DUF402 domain-containing protein n=1 Tax=Alicyclobacillus fastidiosus TaxID=392011 RepID=A0ABY6ZJ22_9BACL|nr:DUF402 domain-containing protein [Alicyclobacillus fastidiosus]WAH42775.1 DUF402 domain-containing protein [Alicyclobacillus fastidiosus]GMA64688.1 hypothetical protein GCM10025859_51280 [Alicyclobacillus fastidiosus]